MGNFFTADPKVWHQRLYIIIDGYETHPSRMNFNIKNKITLTGHPE
jgi:hypothetical protein